VREFERLNRAAKAHRRLAAGHVPGKIVLGVRDLGGCSPFGQISVARTI